MIKAGLHPNSARDAATLATLDPHETEIQANDPPVLIVLKRMANGETISHEEAHEVLASLDRVVISDPDQCIDKLSGYDGVGVDRIMCMMRFGSLAPEALIRSIERAGRHCIPAFTATTIGKVA